MRIETPIPVRLADYQPFPFIIETIDLEFRLKPTSTRVLARLQVRRVGAADAPLVLNGEQLNLIRILCDTRRLGPNDYQLTDSHLTIPDVPEAFVLETEVEIDPSANSALSGLYVSAGRFCTQCEAEGFRRITFFPDRPDVLSRYRVRIEADVALPRLLSNGNLLQQGEAGEGRHFALWEDPFPKPCYLFALVAGELDVLEDQFQTRGGRDVALRIFVDTGMADRARYAMDSLKRAMAWDEYVYSREYDLDLYMIVAVRDFNFGAMENKGLNIFNSALLLADPSTATDMDYERIESVVAHEYFHNWTGNRITCRDWFQLCLKEGLTVFRDQTFSADMRGAAVQRIKDVKMLRSRQFAEDAGPLAHPVRPTTYLAIDNFYTATIYEKGAEIVRMLQTLTGDAAFRSGMDLYFSRHDGQAVTIEAFLDCFGEVAPNLPANFYLWYQQAGTPLIALTSHWDSQSGTLTLEVQQELQASQALPSPAPMPIPIQFGLLTAEGEPIGETRLAVLDTASMLIRVTGLMARPIISALRGFSAPIRLTHVQSDSDRYVLMAADPDPFNRWETANTLAKDLILARADDRPDEEGEARYTLALARSLQDHGGGHAYTALLLDLPSEPDLALAQSMADPPAIHQAREVVRQRIARQLKEDLLRSYDQLQDTGPFKVEAAGTRALRGVLLDYLVSLRDPRCDRLAVTHFSTASNMTDSIIGLAALMKIGGKDCETALADFYGRWSTEPLVIDKWFAVQARDPSSGALGRMLGLTAHPAFDGRNPNRLRALVGTFTQFNPAKFHDASGQGYAFLGDQILATDPLNPSVAARLVEPLGAWKRYRPDLATLMRKQIERIAGQQGLSVHVFENVSRALG